MSGLTRYMAVLRQFTEAKPTWTVQELACVLEAPPSTVYRTVRELVSNDFLARAGEAQYRLGTAFIQFDRILRLTDPLARLGGAALADIVKRAGIPCVGLLCSLYGDDVMCVADERSEGADLHPSYERGRPMPLTRGATSKIVLAELSMRQLKKLLEGIGLDAGEAADLRKQLTTIRRQGFCIARGEIDEGLIGIAAPILSPVRAIASLSLAVEAKNVNAEIERDLIELVITSANALSTAIGKVNGAEGLIGD